jgi:proteasome lid subunit RPN8/RPN11
LKKFGKERLPTRFALSEAMKKNLPDLEIPEDLMDWLIEHSRQEYPLESCGILAGKNGKITKFYPMENMEKSSSSYLMAPEEQLRVFQEIEEEGLELSAIYHSHPHSPAIPSQRDVNSAFYPDSLILIISLMEDKVPQIGAFQIEEGKFEKKTVKVNQNK